MIKGRLLLEVCFRGGAFCSADKEGGFFVHELKVLVKFIFGGSIPVIFYRRPVVTAETQAAELF